MRRLRVRMGVAAKLAALLGGLAAASTGIALVMQDRTLNADLREAAERRLENAARAGDRLLADHLVSVVERYAAISETPEFRANLEVRHAPTLAFFADRLLESQSAAAIAFLDQDGRIVSWSGDPALARAGVARMREGTGGGQGACVRAGDLRPAPGEWLRSRFGACRFPARGAEATLITADSSVYAVAAVPLRTGALVAGSLLALEAVGRADLEVWSRVLGAELTVQSPGSLPADRLVEPVRFFPGFAVRVSTPYEAERRAVARSRQNLLLSGLAALLLATIVGVLLAHRFARPIRRMRRAVEQVGGDVPDIRIDVRRRDELGDLGRAFNDMIARIRDSEMRLARAQRLARFSNWSIDLATSEVDGGPEFRRLFGFREEGAITTDDLLGRVHDDDQHKLVVAIDRARLPRGAFRTDVRLVTGGGSSRILHLRGQQRDDGAAGRVEASAQDITERYNSAKQIEYLSLHDPVTGLGNRQYLFERVSRELSRARRTKARFAGFLIGIHDFPNLTGTMGHLVADELLCDVARRLVETLSSPRRRDRRRVLDAPESCAVRLGDAEFMAVDAVRDRREAGAVARSILEQLTEVYHVEGEEIDIHLSVGISMWPDDGEDVETLVRNCKTALGAARPESRDQVLFYHESLHEEASRRLKMVSSLRRAIERSELEVHYQPRVHASTGRMVAVEALARWESEEFGTVSPGEFIPLAEDAGLVQRLGDWCLQTVVNDLTRWESQGLGDLRVSINISPQQLAPGIVERIVALTQSVDPSRLEFEVTEGAVIHHPERALGLLTALGDHGFRIALDDFGTGYSSLSYIRQLPIDVVKIDQSFVKELGTSEEAMSITWAIIMMCQAVHLEAVAEGVETEAQRRQLVDLGCDEVQGFLFARPMCAADLERLLAEQGLLAFAKTVA